MLATDLPVRRSLGASFPSRWSVLLVTPFLFLSLAGRPAGEAESPRREDPAAAGLFDEPCLRRISLVVGPDEIQRLGARPRDYVAASVVEGGRHYPEVGVRLKGSKGSFRGLDDKPAFTLSFDHFDEGARFHGLRKIHLNNSVEDPSYLNEMLGSELFRAAGVPAPRVAWARVELNGRHLGLYVLKEGFTEDLAGRYFHRADGAWTDDDSAINFSPRRKSQTNGDEAVLTEVAVPTWTDLAREVDVDRFINFMVMEIMVCHRDGYGLARNNFRAYRDPESNRLVFLPHGMDQLFGKADFPWQPRFSGGIARAVMATPEGRERYRSQFAALLDSVFVAGRLTQRVRQLVAALRPHLTEDERAAIEVETRALAERIVQRAEFLNRQLTQPARKPVEFAAGFARLTGWEKADFAREGDLRAVEAPDGIPSLEIRAGPATSASWRTIVRLNRGRYRFEGLAKTSGFTPLAFGRNHGASLRVAGRMDRSTPLLESGSRTLLAVGFAVDQPEEDVELVCEFRADAGRVWFDRDTLRLVQVR